MEVYGDIFAIGNNRPLAATATAVSADVSDERARFEQKQATASARTGDSSGEFAD